MTDEEKTCPRCAETVKQAASVCRYCGHEFGYSGGEFPAAAPPKRKAGGRRAIGCVVALVLFCLVWACSMKLAEPGSKLASTPMGVDGQLANIRDKVARDAVAQYQIAARSGTAMDRCTQAGLVTAAFLQAQNQASYEDWKKVEESDCRDAGVRR